MDSIGQYEGSVAPAFMQRALQGRPDDMIRKLPLRLGRVTKVYDPKDQPNNRNQKYYEYDVMVDEGSEHRPSSRFTLNNCIMLSQFGGVADYSNWTPRPLAQDKHDATKEGIGFGSQVLVLLVNGSTFGGVILGGIQHMLGAGDDAATAHIFDWRFNGIRQTVNDDGEYHVVYTGKSKEDGTSDVDSAVIGTGTHFLKDGGWKVNTKDEEQFIFVDHASHIVSVQAKDDLKILSNGTFTWESAKAATLKVGDKLEITAQADIVVTSSTGKLDISTVGDQSFSASAGLIKTTSLGVHLGNATDAMVLGTTYRLGETTLMNGLMAGIQTVLASLTTAGASLTAAGASLSAAGGAMAVPIVGAVAAGPIVAAAGGTVTAAGAAVTAALAGLTAQVAAITAFEAAAATYLSLKNKLDF